MRRISSFLVLVVMIGLLFAGSGMGVRAAWDSKQKAVIVYGHTPQDYGQQAFFDVVDEAESVGADTISLTIDWYQETASDSIFYRGKATPRDDMLIAGIRYIRSQGLDVYLLIRPETSQWRAEIDPTDRSAWFDNYGAILNKYADMGKAEGVKGLSLGTEMYKVTSVVYNRANEAGWNKMIGDVKERFNGELTYSAQHSGDKSDLFEINFWGQMDYIGVSAYFYLEDSHSSDLKAALIKSWAKIDADYIKKANKLYRKPVIFTELGYRNIEQSYRDPWNAGVERAESEKVQSIAYDALLSYWSDKSYFGGWHIWSYEATSSRLPAGNTKFSPQGKLAESVLARAWGGEVLGRSGEDAQEGDYIQCVDTPPLRDNKGWDEYVGNCHVNGEPWITGISDQPGYEVGDTLEVSFDGSVQVDPAVDESQEPENTDSADTVDTIDSIDDPIDNPESPTVPSQPTIGNCTDTPPYGDNKGWNDKAAGQKNCHVNGELWITGISDQPGYEMGDTAAYVEHNGDESEPDTDTDTGTDTDTDTDTPPLIIASQEDVPDAPENDANGFPVCPAGTDDHDGNGWGWDRARQIGCVIGSGGADLGSQDLEEVMTTEESATENAGEDMTDANGFPVCPAGTDDHDQNGWGWDPTLGGGTGKGCIMP